MIHLISEGIFNQSSEEREDHEQVDCCIKSKSQKSRQAQKEGQKH